MLTPGFQTCSIIGFGNPQRRDDGIGPCVVDRLRGLLRHSEGVHLLAVPQLTADLAGDLYEADRILFADATMADLAGGWSRCAVYPETCSLPYLTHHVTPAYLMGLIQTLYHRSPSAWLISIQGYDFSFGEGLSPAAEKRMQTVSSEILQFMEKKIDREKYHRNKDHTGENDGKPSRHPYY